jgi:catechol 2,3-dioxygenase-like lactoylglutathione lyase family enzyme
MSHTGVRLAGVELYFEDLPRAAAFYRDTLGFAIQEHVAGHHAKFDLGQSFICLERRGVEDYPSADKAVVFCEVQDLAACVSKLPAAAVVGSGGGSGQRWAAVRDPEGHTVMLLERNGPRSDPGSRSSPQ